MKKIILLIGLLFVLAACEQSNTTDTYTVTYDSNGGTEVLSVEVESNTTIVEPSTPIKEGYTFLGWYSDSTFNHSYNFANP